MEHIDQEDTNLVDTLPTLPKKQTLKESLNTQLL
jgi:hypothetical protein